MSRAEIAAWQLGVDIEREVADADPAATRAARLDWPQLTTGQAEARYRLGDEGFAYWVLRGAQDALAARPG